MFVASRDALARTSFRMLPKHRTSSWHCEGAHFLLSAAVLSALLHSPVLARNLAAFTSDAPRSRPPNISTPGLSGGWCASRSRRLVVSGSRKYLCGRYFSTRLNWRGSESRAAGTYSLTNSLLCRPMDARVLEVLLLECQDVLIARTLSRMKSNHPIYRKILLRRLESTDQRSGAPLTDRPYPDCPTSSVYVKGERCRVIIVSSPPARDRTRFVLYRVSPHGVLGGDSGNATIETAGFYSFKLSNIRLKSLRACLV